MNEANSRTNTEGVEEDNRNSTGRWLALGVGVGAAIGAATHNMAVWVAFGAAIGVCFGLIVSQFKSS